MPPETFYKREFFPSVNYTQAMISKLCLHLFPCFFPETKKMISLINGNNLFSIRERLKIIRIKNKPLLETPGLYC